LYRAKDRTTKPLFADLFPFGGKLNEANRWLKIAQLIPWDKLEQAYSKHFSHTGRPAHDARLVIGLLLLKHMTGSSDAEVVQLVQENPYMQAFCGLDDFASGSVIDPSTLTYVRRRLKGKPIKELEQLTYQTLIDHKIIKAKGLMIDATVFPENIAFPNDAGLLNKARGWLVEQVKIIGQQIGKKFRTYSRTAQQQYLGFSKRKNRTAKEVRHITKVMLQFTRRNIRQLEDALEMAAQRGIQIAQKTRERLTVVKELFRQQAEMYGQGVHRIGDRIVSLHKPWVRPIKRGKLGKDTEFGPKASLSLVDGFAFLDRLSSDNFNEAGDLELQLQQYQERFGQKPSWVVGDHIYGTAHNRDLTKQFQIRDAFVPRGRLVQAADSSRRWRRQRHRERNRIEGAIGLSKVRYGLDRIKYSILGGDDIWIRLGLMAANLKMALARI
jgi:IS5 family transposase